MCLKLLGLEEPFQRQLPKVYTESVSLSQKGYALRHLNNLILLKNKALQKHHDKLLNSKIEYEAMRKNYWEIHDEGTMMVKEGFVQPSFVSYPKLKALLEKGKRLFDEAYNPDEDLKRSQNQLDNASEVLGAMHLITMSFSESLEEMKK